jgi:Homeodomain-like domain
MEIIHLLEQSHLPVRRTLEMLGIKPSTFYRRYDHFRTGGPETLEDRPSKPDRVWNRIPDAVRQRVVAMALDQPELSPRELATRFTDSASYHVSESSVYRLSRGSQFCICEQDSAPLISRKLVCFHPCVVSWQSGFPGEMRAGSNQRCFDLRLQLFSKLYWQFDVRSPASSVCDGQYNRPVICRSGVNVAQYFGSSPVADRACWWLAFIFYASEARMDNPADFVF